MESSGAAPRQASSMPGAITGATEGPGVLSFAAVTANAPRILEVGDDGFYEHVLMRSHEIPVVVFNFKKRGNIARVVTGERIGTTVTAG